MCNKSKLRRSIYHNGLLIIASLGLATLVANAQVETIDKRDPQLKEGQLFVVKITPAGKKLEVLVSGKKIADLKISEVGLAASLKFGDRVLNLHPERQNGRFVMDSPETNGPAQLKLKLQHGKDAEQFEFKINQRKL